MMIPATKDIYSRLLAIKKKRGIKTWCELLSFLLTIYESFGKLSVMKIMCSDMRETVAILPVWYKKLRDLLNDEDLVVEALRYLKQKEDEPEIFIVNTEKCGTKPQNT